MPELPEVETIRLGLQKFLVGHTVKDIVIHLPKQFRGDKTRLIGAKAVAARRFGKGLIIDFDNEYSLAIHVKMTGQLLYKREGWRAERQLNEVKAPRRAPAANARMSDGAADRQSRPPESEAKQGRDGARQDPEQWNNLPDKYTHVVFHLDNHALLYYRDVRQFGWMHVLPTKEVSKLPFFAALGKEPLKDLTFSDFQTILQKYKTSIKILIMDQKKIAGVGNIYANDALYRAKIHPQRSASSLSPQEAKALFSAIEYVLRKGIEVGGASEWHYVNVLGGKGQYQNFFEVYHKTGKPCPHCGTSIEKIVLGGRGTFFCPTCQG